MRTVAEALAPRTRFALLVIDGGDSDCQRTVTSLARQVYEDFETWLWRPDGQVSRATEPAASALPIRVISASNDAEARNVMANGTTADFVVALDAGDDLVPQALFELAEHIARTKNIDVIYSDEDRLTPAGPADPAFKPDWSPEYLCPACTLGKLLAMRRSAVQAAGGYRDGLDGAHEYDLALRLTESGSGVAHVPAVLCHRGGASVDRSRRRVAERWALQDFCRESGRDATVTAGDAPGIWRLRRKHADTSRITIVIPTDARSGPTFAGHQPLITQCLRSILERTSYPHYDLVIADNGEFPDDAAALLKQVPHERVTYRWTGAFNFSRKINFAVAHATGDYVLLLNDDVQVINRDWLTAMLEYARHAPIGAVGAKLFYPDGRLQHVGVATGVCGIAAHLLHQYPAGSGGCGQIALSVRNCSAVTGACLLTRRAIYNEVGGFDERLAVDFNDVDFCLRIRRAGYRIVFTPYAKLYHHESASFGPRVQNPHDTMEMRRIWGTALEEIRTTIPT